MSNTRRRCLSEVRSSGRSIPELPDGLRPGPWSEAYAIQDEHHALAGWDTAALKVGCTSTAAQEALRIDEPIGGRIPAEAIFDSGVRLRSAMFLHPPLIECEFAFRIGVDIALTDIFSSRADVARVVDAVAPAVELVDSRFTDFRKVSGPSLVADNSVAAGIVIGQPLSPLSVPEPAGVSRCVDIERQRTRSRDRSGGLGRSLPEPRMGRRPRTRARAVDQRRHLGDHGDLHGAGPVSGWRRCRGHLRRPGPGRVRARSLVGAQPFARPA